MNINYQEKKTKIKVKELSPGDVFIDDDGIYYMVVKKILNDKYPYNCVRLYDGELTRYHKDSTVRLLTDAELVRHDYEVE